jgi:ABC-type oligopeptide transport system substrate-binding subunit
MYLADPWGAGEAIAMQLANVGLAVDAMPASSPREALDIVRAHDYDMMLAGWSADTPDAADYVDALLHSAAIPERGRPLMISCNLARVDDPEVDALLARFRRDPRAETLVALERRVAEHAALVPLCHGDVMIVCGPRVRELPLMPSNMPDYRRIELR